MLSGARLNGEELVFPLYFDSALGIRFTVVAV